MEKLRILILEDNPADAELMERQLRKDGIHFRPPGGWTPGANFSRQ